MISRIQMSEIAIVISRLLKRHSIAKRSALPYSLALRRDRRPEFSFQRVMWGRIAINGGLVYAENWKMEGRSGLLKRWDYSLKWKSRGVVDRGVWGRRWWWVIGNDCGGTKQTAKLRLQIIVTKMWCSVGYDSIGEHEVSSLLYYIVSIHLYSASCSAHQSEALSVRETQREESSLERTKRGTRLTS